MKRVFKYYPEDFGELPVEALHMDLTFDMFPDYTNTTNTFKMKAKKNLQDITLDARNLEVHEVSCDQTPCSFTYNKKAYKLKVAFNKTIPKGATFTIITKTTCKPSKHDLMGLYYDETPPGAPPTMITQCQQWGFQRLTPCFDDMTAKCTYATTIIADERYTNMITNGDVVEPKTSLGNGRAKIKYDNTKTPMAPYLTFLGVGTYDTFKKEFVYPEGDKFMLELLVFPGADKNIAMQALEVLNDCIMWIYLFTGRDAVKNREKRKKIWNLIKRRDNGKNVQEEINTLCKSMHFGYKYTGKVYREIGMQNTDIGGMENVGNTTLTANRIMPYKFMADPYFEYMFMVKVHEFYHNQNGSEVTGWSPFEIWLNEAVTVHIERKYSSFVLGEDYYRLYVVLTLLAPSTGTLASDAGPASMPIEPGGFNDTTELVTSITYVKAPEYIRMVETLMGEGKFFQGIDLYYQRFKHSNATRKQWIEAMEEVSGLSLQSMAHKWLKQRKYPVVTVKREYEGSTLTLYLSQEGVDGKGEWEFPFTVAACDREGNTLAEKTHFMQKKSDTITLSNIPEPAFLSVNRGYSFYGKVNYDAPEEELWLQYNRDADIVNKYMAFYCLTDREKLRLLKNPKATADEKIVDMIYTTLANEKLMAAVGASILTLFEDVTDEQYAHKYQDLYDVKEKIFKAVAAKYEQELMQLYKKYSAKTYKGSLVEQWLAGIKDRQVKNSCLSIVAKLEKPAIHALIKKQFNAASNMSDKLAAFSLYINSKAPDKLKILKAYEQEAKQHPVSWEAFLITVARNDSDDAIEIMQQVEKSPAFRIEQSNDNRSLFSVFALNKKKSMLTEGGRKRLEEIILRLAPLNEYNTLIMVKAFNTLDSIERKHQVPLVEILIKVLQTLSPEKEPSVYNTAKRILFGSPKAIRAYEKAKGKLPIKK